MLLGALLVGLVVGISASEEGKQWKPLGEQGVFMGNAQEIDGFPSPEEFFTKYVLTHTPVIMRQAAAVRFSGTNGHRERCGGCCAVRLFKLAL